MIPYENWAPPRHLPATQGERAIGRLVLLAIAALFLLLAFAATGCRSSRPVADTRPNAEIQAPRVGVDTTHKNPQEIPQKLAVDSPKKTLLQRLNPFYKPETQKGAGAVTAQNATQMPRKCKGCQFTTVIGNDNKVSQANIDKNKAAAVLASDSATLQVATNAVAGRGNTATQTATTQQAKDWKAELASPVGKVVAGTAALILLGTALYAFALWRKKKRVESIIS